jgi:hypothetical protein
MVSPEATGSGGYRLRGQIVAAAMGPAGANKKAPPMRAGPNF